MNNQLVIITGGAQGLGLALAKNFLSLGHTVLITSRDVNKAKQISKINNDKILVSELDLLDSNSIRRFKQNVSELSFSSLILVNNAGQGLVSHVLESTEEDRSNLWKINFEGHVQLIQALAPLMKKGDAIINILSVLALRPISNWSIYSASKAAFSNYSIALENELAIDGISVLNVYPAKIGTDFTQNALGPQKLKGHHREKGTDPEYYADKILRRFKRQPSGQLYCPFSVHGLFILNALSVRFTNWVLSFILK